MLSFSWLYKGYALAGLAAALAVLYGLTILQSMTGKDAIVFLAIVGLVLTAKPRRVGAPTGG